MVMNRLDQPMTGHIERPPWRFAIDVGGTFTDCVGVSPSGEVRICKTLSSGRTKGVVARVSDQRTMEDPSRGLDPDGFWNGASLRFHGRAESFVVESHDVAHGTLTLATPLPDEVVPGTAYELSTGDEAPVLGMRYLVGLAAGEVLPPCEVRLGTTRGTNALLERRGAKVGFVTTRGFADLLRIGDQARPHLFEMAIRKPEPLTHAVVEVDERLAADGTILAPLDHAQARTQLRGLQTAGVESLAIALLHAYRNPVHERALGELAREMGFREVVLSHEVSPSIKIVPRAESTVLDAYLNPVLREYVRRIENGLRQGRMGTLARHSSVVTSIQDGQMCPSYDDDHTLLLMTSSGGLVPTDRFSGKESVLSGPAGGAIGYSTTASRAGHPMSIGFDMGGTSTDVSRFDGRFELETESRKAGIRIASPTLAIETVAAGGGSLCGFDGVKLTVGPASAGAEPGPACYGRGGPLTITDCNLFLGRIIAGRFPFPLNVQAAESRLVELADRVRAVAGYTLTIEQLAEGLIAIANSHMARAVRRISVARGYDPQEYALAVFGGAGAQHACELARDLGMRTIVVHPLASVLSAYGIACAGETRHASRTLLMPLSTIRDSQLRSVFEELSEAASGRRESADSPASQRQVERSLDLRYVGIESTITITEPSRRTGTLARPEATRDGPMGPFCVHDFLAAYEAAHQREFGFRREGRPVEVVAARVLVTHAQSTPPDVPVGLSWQPAAGETQRVRVAGRWVEVTPWERTPVGRTHWPVLPLLTTIDSITGPALICESMTTLFVEEGWRAEIDTEGSIRVCRTGTFARSHDTEDATEEKRLTALPVEDREPHQTPIKDGQTCPSYDAAPDPIRLEIFNNLFASIAEQMGETLRRTSVSTNVKERLDYSCALFDGQGELIVNAPHIPVHLGAMSETVKHVLADNADLQPGDVVLTNDPYRGGSHLPDLTVVTPVFGAAGAILFIVASRAHHAELGGIVPGSMPPFSKTLADEGVLIRNLRIVRQGVFQEAALRQLLTASPHPSRRPDDNVADVTAQIAANQTGVSLLDRLIETHSLPTVQQYMQFIREAAAAKVRRALSAMPDGEYHCVDHLDDGSPISACITIEGDSARVSFVGTGPVLGSNLNANRAIVTSAVLYVFRTLINEEIPLNGGVLIPVTIELPECLLNPPSHDDPAQCAAIVGGNVETSQRVVDVLLGALKMAAASQGTMNNLTFGDATFGYYETICGGSGATRNADGADAVQVHMTNTRLTDVELLEHRYPVRVHRFAIRRESGGRGQQHGGDGIIREIEFLRPMTASILSQRRGPYPPPGMEGGQPGQLGRNTLIRDSGETTDLGGAAQVSLQPGDRLRIETPGGGGWGGPPDRVPSPTDPMSVDSHQRIG
jgi:5-oxoprolinase (ATP-hydrolysing)